MSSILTKQGPEEMLKSLSDLPQPQLANNASFIKWTLGKQDYLSGLLKSLSLRM
jgi:hypothetical protein